MQARLRSSGFAASTNTSRSWHCSAGSSANNSTATFAVWCADPFRVVAWAIEALDIERRRAWNQAKGRKIPASPGRRERTTGDSQRVARSRYALWRNPGDLNRRQRQQLEWIANTDPRL